jgi:hypothetical protein
MKTRTLLIYVLLLLTVLSRPALYAGHTPISSQGTVSFILHIDKAYNNGKWEHVFTQNLVEIPGLGNCIFERNYVSVSISFRWEKQETHKGFYLLFTELPGPAQYAITFTWDAEKGLSDMYMNGKPARLENPGYYAPWEVKGKSAGTRVPPGPNPVTHVNILPRYTPEQEAVKQVPKELYGKMAYLLTGKKDLPPTLETGKRKGKLLYSSKMNNEAAMKDWVLEGPAKITFKDEMMIMRSLIPNPPDVSTGHFNYWCPMDFPGNFIVEWEFKPLKEQGLTHLFFAAKGKKGENLFDPSLPERDGHYRQYHDGAVDNYYVIYYSNRKLLRTTNIARSHLNKAAKLRTLTYGQIAITPGPDAIKFHRLRVIKDGGHIQLLVNDKVYLDTIDTGDERWGPILRNGKIGFRQMAVTEAAYRNFKVWELR